MKLTAALFVFLLLNCSSLQESKIDGQKHFRAYSMPENIFQQDPNGSDEKVFHRLLLVQTNNWSGQLITAPPGPALKPLEGGVSYLSSYLEILRKKFPGSVLHFNAGDSLAGSLIANSFQGTSVLRAMEALQTDAAIFGDRDFLLEFPENDSQAFTPNFASQGLQRLGEKSRFPFLLSNVEMIKKRAPIAWKGIKQTHIIDTGELEIGVYGIFLPSIAENLAWRNFQGLRITSPELAARKAYKKLKESKVDAVVAIVHGFQSCHQENHQTRRSSLMRPFAPDKQPDCLRGELADFLRDIPRTRPDALLYASGGHRIASKIEGVPVMQAPAGPSFFSTVELVFDKKKKLVPEYTTFHPPVQVCRLHSNKTKDCFEYHATKDRKQIERKNFSPATFLGETVSENNKLKKLISPYDKKVRKLREKKLGTLPERLKSTSDEEFGEKVSTLVASKLGVDLSILPKYSVESRPAPGPLTYGKLFQSLPITDLFIRAQINYSDKQSITKNVEMLKKSFYVAFSSLDSLPESGSISFVTFLHLRPFIRAFFRKNDRNLKWQILRQSPNYRDTVAKAIQSGEEGP